MAVEAGESDPLAIGNTLSQKMVDSPIYKLLVQ